MVKWLLIWCVLSVPFGLAAGRVLRFGLGPRLPGE